MTAALLRLAVPLAVLAVGGTWLCARVTARLLRMISGAPEGAGPGREHQPPAPTTHCSGGIS